MTDINNEYVLCGLNQYNQIIDRIISELPVEGKPDVCFDIRLILVEAITNAFKHGNKSDETKNIVLRYTCSRNKIIFEIKDTGTWEKNSKMPVEISDSDLLNEDGRGLYLINCIADAVEFKNGTMVIEKAIENN